MKKQFLLWLTVIALLLSGLCACRGSGQTPAESTKKPADTDPGGTVDPAYDHDIGGTELTVYTSVQSSFSSTSSNTYIEGSNEATADAVAYSAYYRNQELQDRMNYSVKYIHVDSPYATVPQYFRPLFRAEEPMDLIISKLAPMATLTLEGHFVNVAGSPAVDWWDSYWYYDYMESLSLDNGNSMYLMASDYFIDVLRSTNILIYNIDLMENTFSSAGGNAALLEKINSGEWYLETLLTYISDAYRSSGNSQKGDGDTFGYVSDNIFGALIPFVVSSGLKYVEQDESSLKLAMDVDRCDSLLKLLNRLFFNDGTAPYTRASETRWDLNLPVEGDAYFLAGKALFVGAKRFGNLEQMTDAPFRYGVLPYPKMDESQEKFITSSHDTTEIGAIPRGCKNAEAVMTVVNALSKKTGNTVMTKYYTETLKLRYSVNSEQAQIIDIIHDNYASAFPLAYANYCNDAFIRKAFYEPFLNGDDSFAGNYRTFQEATDSQLKKMLKDWTKISG